MMKLLLAVLLSVLLMPAYGAQWSDALSSRVQQAIENSPEQAQAEFVALIKNNKPFTFQELEQLIKRGADVNARSFEGGRTALMVVAENVGANFVLFDSGVEANQKARDQQAQHRRAIFERMAFLIHAGAEVNLRVNDGKNSPYLLYVVGGDNNVLSMLLEGLKMQKGNPDLADDNGLRPIDMAAKQHKPAAYKLLVKAGADALAPSPALGGKSPKEFLEEEARQASGGDETFARQFLSQYGY